MRQIGQLSGVIVAAVAISAVLIPGQVARASQQLEAELIVFPSVTGQRLFDPNRSDNSEVIPAASLFVTAKIGAARFLAEYFTSSEEQELERVQIGVRLGGETVAWVGRFHNPIGYWNTTFHHGSFLQASVSRPAIVAFEDDGGVLPMHVTGALLQGAQPVGQGALAYEVALGVGPEFSADNLLEPLDIVEPRTGAHRFSSAAKLVFRPDPLEEDEIAGFFAYTNIPAAGARADIEQVLGGGYLLWTPGELRILAAGFYVDDDLDASAAAGAASSSFASGYVHAEWRPVEEITAYARVEASTGVGGDAYRDLFPEVVRGRTVAGMRFEIGERQAIKFEFGDTRRSGKDGEEILIQWSAAFP